MSKVPVWVRLHDVPLAAFTSDGLRSSSYPRDLIEIHASNDMLDSLVVVVPKLEESGLTKETICIEYGWKLSRCGTCSIFGHSSDLCPKAVNEVNVSNLKVVEDGFHIVKNDDKGENMNSRSFLVLKLKFVYRPKDIPAKGTWGLRLIGKLDVESNSKEHEDNIPKVNIKSTDLGKSTKQANEDSESDVEGVHDETTYFMASKLPKATAKILIKMEVELKS
nr:hypothetical protein [Tanacetum cinerariifolium]